MLSLSQRQSLQQRLSPQQVQYLKMLQLPVIALEQRIKQELEANPMLEELSDTAQETETEFEQEQPITLTPTEPRTTEPQPESPATPASEAEETRTEEKSEHEYEWEEFFADQYDNYNSSGFGESDEDEQEEFPQRSEETLADQLLAQLRMQTMSEDDLALAEEIIGSIDEHGYLRRDLREIVDDLNKFITATERAAAAHPLPHDHILGDGHFDAYEEMVTDEPFGRDRIAAHILTEHDEHDHASHLDDRGAHASEHFANGSGGDRSKAHARAREKHHDVEVATAAPSSAKLSLEEMSQLSIEELARLLEQGTAALATNTARVDVAVGEAAPGENSSNEELEFEIEVIPVFSLEEAERILHRIQRLDPPGIGARDLRECLLVQLELQHDRSPVHQLAHRMIDETYNEFTMKHFEKICDRLKCTTDDLKGAIEVIKGLNPKPGEGSVSIINDNYLTPDFVIERDAEDFLILPNDRHIPTLRINRAYQELMRRGKAKKNGIDRDTRKFLREKFEAAKWFIASIQQRRQTMMKVMRAIVDLQRDFFTGGPNHIRPMIYKDVAERIGMDISTVCRVVNGKYVQTDYGTFELRYFFSEKLETTSGEEVSTKIVKSRIQELIEAEDKHKPLSDDAISKMMKKAGFYVARRTVAKYREQMSIPVARLRRAL
jgi:RNA polymerase sigma-54 factor